MDVPIDNMGVITLPASPSSGCQDTDNLTTRELLARCARRPADESAWQEFVRRFHPAIRHSVERALCLKTTAGKAGNALCNEEVIDSVVQAVYGKLVENRCQALKRLDETMADSIRSYLVLLAIAAVREYLQGAKPS